MLKPLRQLFQRGFGIRQVSKGHIVSLKGFDEALAIPLDRGLSICAAFWAINWMFILISAQTNAADSSLLTSSKTSFALILVSHHKASMLSPERRPSLKRHLLLR
jgi:hypothetical protein